MGRNDVHTVRRTLLGTTFTGMTIYFDSYGDRSFLLFALPQFLYVSRLNNIDRLKPLSVLSYISSTQTTILIPPETHRL